MGGKLMFVLRESVPSTHPHPQPVPPPFLPFPLRGDRWSGGGREWAEQRFPEYRDALFLFMGGWCWTRRAVVLWSCWALW